MSASKSYNKYDDLTLELDKEDIKNKRTNRDIHVLYNLFNLFSYIQNGYYIAHGELIFGLPGIALSQKYIDKFLVVLEILRSYFEKEENKKRKLTIYINHPDFYLYLPFINVMNNIAQNNINIVIKQIDFNNFAEFNNLDDNILKENFFNYVLIIEETEGRILVSKTNFFQMYGLNKLSGSELEYFELYHGNITIYNKILNWNDHFKALLDFIQMNRKINVLNISIIIFNNPIFQQKFLDILLSKNELHFAVHSNNLTTLNLNINELPFYFQIATEIDYNEDFEIIFYWDQRIINKIKNKLLKKRRSRQRAR